MHAEAVRLTRLLDDLARLADAERPGLMIDKTRLDLATVAHIVAESFAPRFEAAGISFTVSAESAPVDGDIGRLQHVVANLLSNALAYTEAGGQVTPTVRHAGKEAMIEVADTGIGIAPDHLRHIFTRFWRADRSRSRSTGGTGIGLSTGREPVRAHSGRIDVDSTPGQGSRLQVILPATSPSPAVSLTPPSRPVSPVGRSTGIEAPPAASMPVHQKRRTRSPVLQNWPRHFTDDTQVNGRNQHECWNTFLLGADRRRAAGHDRHAPRRRITPDGDGLRWPQPRLLRGPPTR